MNKPTTSCSHDHKDEREVYEMAVPEKIKMMSDFHQQGNQFFEEGQYPHASRLYKRALVYYEYTFPEADDKETWARIDQIRLTCNLNSAACHIKMGDLEEAANNCYQVTSRHSLLPFLPPSLPLSQLLQGSFCRSRER